MFHKKLEEVNNPLIYIFLSIACSCICYGIYSDLRGLSIFIAALFFVYIIFYFGAEFCALIGVLFLIGLYVNVSYYTIGNKSENIVRVIEKNDYNTIGRIDGKNIILDSKYEFIQGRRYYIKGSITGKSDKYKGIIGSITPYEIITQNDDYISKMYEFKRNIFDKLEENIGKRKAGLITSIAFGDSNNIDPEDKEDMKNYGIIHSVSVSGLHVAVIYGFLKYFLGNSLGLILSGIYIIFTGCEYSSIRAFVMLVSIEGAKIFKRNNNSVSALSLSAVILLIYKPYSIMEISFHLSYLATLGIILLNRYMNFKLYKLPSKLRESLSLTLSAQVFIFPYMMIIFRDFSMNFILGNLLLMPFADLLVILGNMLIAVYRFSSVFDFVSYICLYVVKGFDYIINRIDMYSLPIFYGNEYMEFLYLWILISIYFIKRGQRKFIYIPFIAVLVIMVSLYSPVLNIRYYREGGILVSYKGDRVLLVSSKSKTDIDRLSKIAMATKSYKMDKNINIKNKCYIKSLKKDYILYIDDKEFILNMSGKENYPDEYDIINFKNGPENKIFIIHNELIKVCS
ncbi:MAG: ComEC/Rec2 family competence protein [Clostridium sp.]